MKINTKFLENYATQAPLALAFERVMECRILSRQTFERPILDIGCGEGLFAHVLFTEKIDTGIDPNARELQRAHALGGYHELIECFGDSIPRPDGAYQTVLSNSVVEHIPNLGPVLREAFRLLALEGKSGKEAAAQLGMKVGTVIAARCDVQKMIQKTIQRIEQADATRDRNAGH